MSYFIKVEDSSGIRKRVLESTKETIMMLKRYQLLLELKSRKKEVVITLKKDIKELNLLILELQKIVPIESLKELQAYLPKHKKERVASKGKKGKAKAKAVIEDRELEKIKEVKANKPKPKQLSEMEKLEKALDDIDAKLSQL